MRLVIPTTAVLIALVATCVPAPAHEPVDPPNWTFCDGDEIASWCNIGHIYEVDEFGMPISVTCSLQIAPPPNKGKTDPLALIYVNCEGL